jgi:16S rRNA (cytosine967-C5)-methyltransferase
MLSARAVALEALSHGGDAAEHLDRALRNADLSPADRAFATELAYGTLKMRRSLEWSVARFVTRPFAQLEPRLRWILLLGAYQLVYLDRVPVHSAVDESVRLARTGGHKGIAGLANAVLRKVALEKPKPPVPTLDGGPLALGLFASLPDFIAAHLIDRFGFDDALRAAQGMNGPPARALRLDLRCGSAEEFIARLTAGGAKAVTGRYGIPECVVIERLGDGSAVREAIESGQARWQSEESQLAVHLLDPRPGDAVLDACSGRGVKTTMIAGRLQGDGAIWCVEDDEKKVAALSKTAAGDPSHIVHVVRADARTEYPAKVPSAFDAALVDAPCSGLGVIGRQPDARWRKKDTDPARFASVQAAVLRQAAGRVRPGGRLMYVTCSTHALEDESIADEFLAAHPEWRAAALQVPESPAIRKLGEYALTLPGVDGADGFFYALMTRTSP